MARLQPKQKAFATNVVQNGGDKVKARADAGYSTKMAIEHQRIDADKLFNHPNISLMIADLQKEADKVAREAFAVTVEERVKWLKEIVNAGLDTYSDQHGNNRRENLAAAKGAIETLNSMLGVDDNNNEAEALTINFAVKQSVGDIKITKGK